MIYNSQFKPSSGVKENSHYKKTSENTENISQFYFRYFAKFAFILLLLITVVIRFFFCENIKNCKLTGNSSTDSFRLQGICF